MSNSQTSDSKNTYVDPALPTYEQGIKAFFGKKYDKAAGLFEKVQEEADQSNLAARAQVFLTACTHRTEDEPSTDDPFLEAVVAKNNGDLETAADLCSRGGRKGKDERFAFLAASVAALQGDQDEALAQLTQAVEMNPENRVFAYHDPDFDSLRENDAFTALIHPEGEDEVTVAD